MWYNILKIKRLEVYYIKEVFRCIKVKLYPTKEQIEYFELCVKARNFAYNWGLEIWGEHYNKTKSNIGMYSLNNMFNEYKKLEENKWLYLVCSKICSLTFKDLENAYHKYFKGLKNKPIFKNDKSKKSFPVRLDNITITDKYIKISKKKYIKYKNNSDILPKGYFNGNTKTTKLSNGRITYDGINWYFSMNVKVSINNNSNTSNEILGIDFGMKNYMVLSNGKIYNHILNDERIVKEKKNIVKLYRKLSNKYKINGYNKTKDMIRLEKLINIKYKKIKNIKNTYLHKITKEIVDLKPKKIVVERFETLRLYKQFRYKRSKEFSKRLMELNFYTLQRYLKYKCENNGIEYIEVDKNYSATQRCSNCGNVKVGDNKLSINHRVYKCDKCGLEMDRDFNASINLKKYTT